MLRFAGRRVSLYNSRCAMSWRLTLRTAANSSLPSDPGTENSDKDLAQRLEYLQRNRHHLRSAPVSAAAVQRHVVVHLDEADIVETFARGSGPGEFL